MHSAYGGGGFHRGRQGRQPTVVILAAVCCVGLFLGIALLLIMRPKASEPITTVVVQRSSEPSMVDVLVPVSEIQPGTQLDPSLFRHESRPAIAVGSRTIKSPEELHGNYARTVLPPGQPLEREFITSIKPASPITAAIPAGYRAVAISVDARSSVEGWARPGAKVDVTWASNIRGQAGVSVIVQNARILSAERDVEAINAGQKTIPATVTLLVPADDASRIQLASTSGTLNLALRGDGDRGRGSAVRSITTSDLLGGAAEPGLLRNPDAVVKLRGKNGQFEELVFKNGKLLPKDALQ